MTAPIRPVGRADERSDGKVGRPLGTVARAITLLRVLAEAGGEVSLAGLATAVALPRPTVHRLLGLLREQGMVEQDPANNRYQVGVEFYRLAALVSSKREVTKLARPLMERLSEQTGESCVLALYRAHDRRMIYAEHVSSKHPLGYRIALNRPSTLVWGASGRAILAHLAPEDIEAVARGPEPSPVAGERLTATQLKRDLAAIRACGYAATRSQKIADARGIAAPIFAAASTAIGSICMTIPEHRYEAESEQQLAELVVATARELSVVLGYRAEVEGGG
jgi:DNA-binding IclR family transcriptional regulator